MIPPNTPKKKKKKPPLTAPLPSTIPHQIHPKTSLSPNAPAPPTVLPLPNP